MDNSIPKDDSPSAISRDLYNHIICKSTPKTPNVEKIAHQMGWSPSLLYKILEGEKRMHLEDFPRFFEFANRPMDALNRFLRECDPNFILTELQNKKKLNGELEDELAWLTILNGDVNWLNWNAQKSGQYNDKQKEDIRKKLIAIRETIDCAILELNNIGNSK